MVVAVVLPQDLPFLLTPPNLEFAGVIPTGALLLTGLAPVVLNPVAVEIPTGALLLTGFAPGVVEGRPLSVPTGAFLLTGFIPTLAGPAVKPQGTMVVTAKPVGTIVET
jgi:hypothetical protein|tara:strand:+ start:3025 stop:3351 length:327 start_codon:yes stop_codon:yes gene_type:complete